MCINTSVTSLTLRHSVSSSTGRSSSTIAPTNRRFLRGAFREIHAMYLQLHNCSSFQLQVVPNRGIKNWSFSSRPQAIRRSFAMAVTVRTTLTTVLTQLTKNVKKMHANAQYLSIFSQHSAFDAPSLPVFSPPIQPEVRRVTYINTTAVRYL
jgi:hypothetical protein